MCVKGMFSTLGGTVSTSVHWGVPLVHQYIGGDIMSTMGGYHEYIGGSPLCMWGSKLIKAFQFLLKTPMH